MSWIENELEAYPLERARADGHTVSYRRAGRGTALVLLHGIGSGSASWLHQLSGLRDRFHLVAWDAPGYGESDALTAEWPGAGDYAAVLAAFVAELGLGSFYLLGHSLGALMGAAFAARHGPDLLGLLLAAPAAGHGDAPEAERNERLESRVGLMDRLGPEGVADRRASTLLSSDPPREALDLVRFNMARLRPDGYTQGARMLARGRLAVDLAEYAGSLHVICGDEDRVTPPTGARAVAAARGADYVEIPRAGHACYIERPSPFNDAILRCTGANR